MIGCDWTMRQVLSVSGHSARWHRHCECEALIAKWRFVSLKCCHSGISIEQDRSTQGTPFGDTPITKTASCRRDNVFRYITVDVSIEVF